MMYYCRKALKTQSCNITFVFKKYKYYEFYICLLLTNFNPNLRYSKFKNIRIL